MLHVRAALGRPFILCQWREVDAFSTTADDRALSPARRTKASHRTMKEPGERLLPHAAKCAVNCHSASEEPIRHELTEPEIGYCRCEVLLFSVQARRPRRPCRR